MLVWLLSGCVLQRLKGLCVGEWRDYCTRLIQRPFRAWFIWAHERRTREGQRRAVVEAFQRRQRYNCKYQIFKMWKHLAVFGKVEGLKSRVALIKALEEQNAFAMALEDTIDKLQVHTRADAANGAHSKRSAALHSRRLTPS